VIGVHHASHILLPSQRRLPAVHGLAEETSGRFLNIRSAFKVRIDFIPAVQARGEVEFEGTLYGAHAVDDRWTGPQSRSEIGGEAPPAELLQVILRTVTAAWEPRQVGTVRLGAPSVESGAPLTGSAGILRDTHSAACSACIV